MNGLFIDGSPILYPSPNDWSAHQSCGSAVGIIHPRIWKDLQTQAHQRTVLFFQPEDLQENLEEFKNSHAQALFLFKSLPRDFEILLFKKWAEEFPGRVHLALPTQHPSSADALLMALPKSVLECVCFYSAISETSGSEYFHFRKFLELDLSRIKSILSARGMPYRFFCLPARFRLAGEKSAAAHQVEDFKIFETRLMFKIFKAGRKPPEDLLKQLLQRLDKTAVLELTSLEAIFHVKLVPDRILYKTSTWLKFGSQVALSQFYNPTTTPVINRRIAPYKTLMASLLIQCLVFLRWNFSAFFLHCFWTFWTPIQRWWGKIWWRPRAIERKISSCIKVNIQRAWGRVWWRPGSTLQKYLSWIKVNFQRTWGRLWWRPVVIFSRIAGWLQRVWGNYWWRPVAHIRGLWGSLKGIWIGFWWRPMMYFRRLLGYLERLWGKYWWRPPVKIQRIWGRFLWVWGRVWWRPLAVMQKCLTEIYVRIRRTWGQIWWRPISLSQKFITWIYVSFRRAWGQLWWRPLALTQRYLAIIQVSLLRTWGQIWWRPGVLWSRFRGWLGRSAFRLKIAIRWASFPIRKVYYMVEYQYHRRILGLTEEQK